MADRVPLRNGKVENTRHRRQRGAHKKAALPAAAISIPTAIGVRTDGWGNWIKRKGSARLGMINMAPLSEPMAPFARLTTQTSRYIEPKVRKPTAIDLPK